MCSKIKQLCMIVCPQAGWLGLQGICVPASCPGHFPSSIPAEFLSCSHQSEGLDEPERSRPHCFHSLPLPPPCRSSEWPNNHGLSLISLPLYAILCCSASTFYLLQAGPPCLIQKNMAAAAIIVST